MKKPVLAGRWRQSTAGILECIWHVEPADASAEQPSDQSARGAIRVLPSCRLPQRWRASVTVERIA
jgi:hypothetical protein